MLALPIPAEAQQAKKVPRIGVLVGGSASSDLARIDALRQGLHELGYVEGKNIVIEYRYAEAKLDRLRGFAAELVRTKVDLIVTAGPVLPRKQRTQFRLSWPKLMILLALGS